MPELPKDLRLRDFVYHEVADETAEKMTNLRKHYYWLADMLLDILPDSRERSLALTALEESIVRAIQCLAVTEGTPIPIGKTVRVLSLGSVYEKATHSDDVTMSQPKD